MTASVPTRVFPLESLLTSRGGSIYVANYRKQESSVSQAIDFLTSDFPVVLENSNMAQLASNLYLSVYSLP
jgi:hypothetical protein